MRRPTAFSTLFSVFKAGSAGTIVLTAILACGDYGTSAMQTPDPVHHVAVPAVIYNMPDSLKYGSGTPGSGSMAVPFGFSADLRSAPSAAASTVAACGGSGFAGYTESRMAFTPEAVPTLAPEDTSISDDGWATVPIGFEFSFYGNTYTKANIFMNGFLMLGPAPAKSQSGTAVGGFLPSMGVPPKNIIALAWSDWDPRANRASGIRFETRGTAPRRKFIVQYDVPELSPGRGRLTGQIVLSEGTNDINLYLNSMTTTNSRDFVTQGIQDLTGTQAMWDSVQNVNNGVWSRRVHNFFTLNNDALRFSLISTSDDVKPTISAPADITDKPNDPGLGSALVVLGDPVASDNCTAPLTITKARNDGEPINAPYPVGTTIVTWTAIDAFGNASSAEQRVTVIDVEDPTIQVSDVTVNAATPLGATASYNVASHDNVKVVSVVCDKESGSNFPIGTNPVSCTASDAAGHTATAHFTVSVLDARTQLTNLIAYVRGLGEANGTTNPLVNQLVTAFDNLDVNNHVSCVKLNDFLAMIPKKGRQIPFSATSYMTTEATRIMSVLGCEMGPRALLVPGSA